MAENSPLKFNIETPVEQIRLPEAARILILPAAGESRRMGRHKLSLPFGPHSLIQHVVSTYLTANVDLIVIVRKPGDQLIVDALKPHEKVVLVTPEIAPPDMKASIQVGLSAVQELRGFTQADLFLLTPPDLPLVPPEVISRLLRHWESSFDFLSPVYQNRKGHPLLFSEKVARKVFDIPEDSGFNWLQKSEQEEFIHEELEVSEPGILFDVDTPEAYQTALKMAGLTL